MNVRVYVSINVEGLVVSGLFLLNFTPNLKDCVEEGAISELDVTVFG